MSGCCGPSGSAAATASSDLLDRPPPVVAPDRDPREVARRMLPIPGGAFRMGGQDDDQFPADGEGPVRTVTLAPYRMDATAVTTAQFATTTGHTGFRCAASA